MATLLYLVPLVTSTVTLWFAFDQYFFLSILVHRKVEPNVKHILTSYWNIMFDIGLPLVITPLLGTMTSTATIFYFTPNDFLIDKGSYNWYMASIALAGGHFAFVPIIAPHIRNLQNGGPPAALRQWLRVHVLRSLTVDLFGWVACVVAAAKTLSA